MLHRPKRRDSVEMLPPATAEPSRSKRAVFWVLTFGLCYGALEIAYSAYRYVKPVQSQWFMEHGEETIQFDPACGFRLTTTPSRIARITLGKIEYSSVVRGNAQGFPDRDDFPITRPGVNSRRFAVFGDSFSAAEYIARNWPDRVEDYCAGQRPALQLMNFSIDGAGLANWASTIRNVVKKDGYVLDGLIFAVFRHDLDRKFVVADGKRGLGYITSWDVAAQPKNLAEAEKYLQVPGDSYNLPTPEFERALSGRWRRPWRFLLLSAIPNALRRIGSTDITVHRGFAPGQLALIHEIRDFAAEKSLATTVVYIPSRDELLGNEGSAIEEVQRFAGILGAKFVDGREAFRGRSAEQIKQDWLPYDGHWNQAGSDRFAGFMTRELFSPSSSAP